MGSRSCGLLRHSRSRSCWSRCGRWSTPHARTRWRRLPCTRARAITSTADKSAAIAYRTRLGFAVVSGDPIGDVAQFEDLVADFVRMCRSRGWQIIVLAGGERHLGLWRSETVGQPMLAVPIGRDVVVDVRHFSLTGRRYRNLRQAVQRTHNCGVTTEIVDEQRLDGALTAELTEVLYAAHRAARSERGFCMNLDGALQGRYPGIKLAIARDRRGRVARFTDTQPPAKDRKSASMCRSAARRPQRRRRASQRRHDCRCEKQWGTEAFPGVRERFRRSSHAASPGPRCSGWRFD